MRERERAVARREVRALGFTATPRQIRGWLQTRRTAPAKTTPHCYRKTCSNDVAGADATTPSGTAAAKLLSPKQLAWLLVRSPGTLSAGDAATLVRVGQDAEAARVAALVRRFVDLVRSCGIAHEKVDPDPLAILDAWIADASVCGVAAVETFAAGLEQDGAAVRAALTMPWSSGQAEGQITKLKLVKRHVWTRQLRAAAPAPPPGRLNHAMCGRAGFVDTLLLLDPARRAKTYDGTHRLTRRPRLLRTRRMRSLPPGLPTLFSSQQS